TPMFTLQFRVKAAGKLSQSLSLGEAIIPSLAVKEETEVVAMDLQFDNAIRPAKEFELQNRPNPFSDVTVIGFTLTETADARLQITDITGKVVKVYQEKFVEGYNEVQVNRTDLSNSGLYFYQLLTTNGQSDIRKMIMLK
ncbi:MAG: T9SS type A sorting domain-containing protein, partial [Saprospiraceae bacterium]